MRLSWIMARLLSLALPHCEHNKIHVFTMGDLVTQEGG